MMAVSDLITSILELIQNPVLVPLAIAGATWLVDQYTKLTVGMNEWLKRLLILVVPVALTAIVNFASVKFGFALDLSTITAAGGSIVAMIIYMIGRNKSLPAA